MTTRKLDWRRRFDSRSRKYGIRAAVTERKPRSYTWGCGATLDQGEEGACVGFAWAHELAARPVRVRDATDTLAREIYREAQKLDEWEGEEYEGTSVLAGAKAVQARGYITEYRWAFSLSDLLLAVSYAGPVVIGVNWYEGMFAPASCGQLHPIGELSGGHATLVRGLDVRRERLLLHNSWGPSWGNQSEGRDKRGTAWISFADFAELIEQEAEMCVPLGRRRA